VCDDCSSHACMALWLVLGRSFHPKHVMGEAIIRGIETPVQVTYGVIQVGMTAWVRCDCGFSRAGFGYIMPCCFRVLLFLSFSLFLVG